MSNRPNRRPQPVRIDDGPSRSLLIPIIIVVVAVAAVAALVVASLGSSDESVTAVDTTDAAGRTAIDPDDAPDVVVEGALLPVLPADSADPAQGTVAPTIEGVDLFGEPMVIGRPGTPQLVFVVAHWCPHCQKEVPIIADWLRTEGAPEGIALLAVSTGMDPAAPNYPPADWLIGEEWEIPTMLDPDEGAKEALGVSGFPFFVALDAEGKVVGRASGELTIPQIEALVEAAGGGAGR